MPEYDEKRKQQKSSASKKQDWPLSGQRHDGGRSKTPRETLGALVRTQAGRDATDVPSHADAAADQKARGLGAKAVSEGQAIFFAKDAYTPETEKGRRLIGHELAHALQQSAGGGTTDSTVALEKEADAVGDRVARGETATVRRKTTSGSRLLKEEKKSPPSFTEHKEEIGPAPPSGTISGPGFTIKYGYSVVSAAKSASLSLALPEGVGVTAAPLGGVAVGDMAVRGAGGVKARTVRMVIGTGDKGVPRVRATFTKGSASLMVVFQFPAGAKA